MKTKLFVGLIVVVMLLGTAGSAAAAPGEIGSRDSVSGDVKSISGAAFTLTTRERGEIQVLTSDRTRFRPRDNANVGLSDLKVGDRVAVQGRWQAGQLQANVVLLIPDDLRDKALGKVAAINGSTLAITKTDGTALNVATTAETKFHARGIANPSFADIKVGDVVVALGQLQGDTLTASHVAFQTPREKTGPLTAGKINAINGSTLTLDQPFGQTLTVTTDANTFVVQRSENGLQVIAVSDLKAGDGVAVLGVRSSDGRSIAARTIVAGNGEGLRLPIGQRARQPRLPFAQPQGQAPLGAPQTN
jgi:hypothetical protein